ncbi:hypothetical protein HYDPIDRAFT_44561 [Hydnomerulius pinastri MD-312]|uniref:Uncharacterized protein n=1 Tax=Hydnomerulius pinastri MD-312 TaxID=994086 RepID=A0A0C9UYZ0_9AGAM|nr:hypothetical protein HYDPIDRAFT_44561 [Hydnomerulius pinastri MD-312]
MVMTPLLLPLVHRSLFVSSGPDMLRVTSRSESRRRTIVLSDVPLRKPNSPNLHQENPAHRILAEDAEFRRIPPVLPIWQSF